MFFILNHCFLRQLKTDNELGSSTVDAQQEELERKQRLDELRTRLAVQQAAVNKLHTKPQDENLVSTQMKNKLLIHKKCQQAMNLPQSM